MNKTAVISGLRIRLDVPTKCKLVEKVLTTSFKTKQEQNEFITSLAEQHFVNPVTIKLWCGKYQNSWKLGKELPKGTMSFAFATIPDSRLPATIKQLEDLRTALNTLTQKVQTKYHKNFKGVNMDSLKTPGKILDELILNKKAK